MTKQSIRTSHHIWCSFGANDSTAHDCPQCLVLEEQFPPDGPGVIEDTTLSIEGPPKPKRVQKYCQYCGSQNLKSHDAIVFGDPGIHTTYECLDCPND